MKELHRSDLSSSTLSSELNDIKLSVSSISTALGSFKSTGEVLKGKGYNAVRNSVQASNSIVDSYIKPLDNGVTACKNIIKSMSSYLDSCEADDVDDKYKQDIAKEYTIANNKLMQYEMLAKDTTIGKDFSGFVFNSQKVVNRLKRIKENIDKLDEVDTGQYKVLVNSITNNKTDKIKKVPTMSSLFDDIDFTNYSLGGLNDFSDTFFYSLDNYDYFKNMPPTSKKILIEAFSYLGKGIIYSQRWRNQVYTKINGKNELLRWTNHDVLDGNKYYLDCSSFVSKVYKSVFPDDFGVAYDVDDRDKVTSVIGLMNTKLYEEAGLIRVDTQKEITSDKLVAGDLVMQRGKAHHVVIYVGDLDTSKGKKTLVIHCYGQGIGVTTLESFTGYSAIARHDTVNNELQ